MKLKHYSEELLLDKLAAFTLSRKAKEAINVALAITACYGIALSLDWERLYWAGFVVAFCSLASIGQSLNPAALRMAGTLLGVLAKELDATLDKLEIRVKGVLDQAPSDEYSDQAAENFYRLLGISRGVSKSLVDYVQKTAVIDWSTWHEERFV